MDPPTDPNKEPSPGASPQASASLIIEKILRKASGRHLASNPAGRDPVPFHPRDTRRVSEIRGVHCAGRGAGGGRAVHASSHRAEVRADVKSRTRHVDPRPFGAERIYVVLLAANLGGM